MLKIPRHPGAGMVIAIQENACALLARTLAVAAKILGIDREILREKLKRLGTPCA
jgi:hypothetical protein